MRPLLLPLLLAGLLTGCAEVDLTEHNFIRPDAATKRAPAQTFAEAGFQELTIEPRDGGVLRGVVSEHAGARLTVLYFGGNMFHIDEDMKTLAPLFARCGVNVAAFDYRGYGRSKGEPTIANMSGDALAVFDAVEARFPGRVVVHGQSLGSFIAARVAQERPVRGVVLESTATNALDWAKANTPWYAKPFVRYALDDGLQGIDNARAAARFRSPALVIAGQDDRVTPAALGRIVFEAAPTAGKRFLVIEGAGHNDALDKAGAAYCAFLDQLR